MKTFIRQKRKKKFLLDRKHVSIIINKEKAIVVVVATRSQIVHKA